MSLTLSFRSAALVVTSGVLLTTGLAACGAPSDANKDEFCGAATALNDSDDNYQAILDGDWKKIERSYRDIADDLEEIGTPKGISDKARDGYDVYIDQLRDISADDIEKAVEDGEDVRTKGVDGDDSEKLAEFNKYVLSTCAGDGE